MFESPVKSRPQYGKLEPDLSATINLILGEGAGIKVIEKMLEKASGEFRARAIVIIVGGEKISDKVFSKLRGLHRLPTISTALIRLDQFLTNAVMGLRLYATGTESFIGQVIQVAEKHSIDHKSILTEHSGSLMRRVQCVHCKGITDEVRTNIVKCSHCGVQLAVRDHYSRRIGAFMAVSADAEQPGQLPPIEEIYK